VESLAPETVSVLLDSAAKVVLAAARVMAAIALSSGNFISKISRGCVALETWIGPPKPPH
jgi:hypothetical protein